MKPNEKERIYLILKTIPYGCISSYGKVAEYAQLHNGARLVGRVLTQLPKDTALPWHRVLKANGQIAFPIDTEAFQRQKQCLESEGIIVANGRVNLSKFSWKP
jgi:methylated-DNA-protein-cysteine methyltransferase-like protein